MEGREVVRREEAAAPAHAVGQLRPLADGHGALPRRLDARQQRRGVGGLREGELVQFFKDKGIEVTEVDTAGFKEAVAKNVTFEQFGYRKEDWDRIQAVKSGS